MRGGSNKNCIKYEAPSFTSPDLHKSTYSLTMCFESKLCPRWSPPSVKKIADIAPVSYRAYQFLKKELTAAYIDLQKKREERRNRKYMRPWLTRANTTKANPRIDPTHLAMMLAVKASVMDMMDTKESDMKKLGQQREALGSHPPFGKTSSHPRRCAV
ncbi:hypothetical protein ACQKWADRAFT_276384 [Trichoderma austrokoningii]